MYSEEGMNYGVRSRNDAHVLAGLGVQESLLHRLHTLSREQRAQLSVSEKRRTYHVAQRRGALVRVEGLVVGKEGGDVRRAAEIGEGYETAEQTQRGLTVTHGLLGVLVEPVEQSGEIVTLEGEPAGEWGRVTVPVDLVGVVEPAVLARDVATGHGVLTLATIQHFCASHTQPSLTRHAIDGQKTVVFRAGETHQTRALPTPQKRPVQLVLARLQQRGVGTTRRVVQHTHHRLGGVGSFSRFVPKMKTPSLHLLAEKRQELVRRTGADAFFAEELHLEIRRVSGIPLVSRCSFRTPNSRRWRW